MMYSKVPKFWDSKNLCCNLPTIQTKRPNLKVNNEYNINIEIIKVFHQKDANGIANSGDPDLGLHCSPISVCPKT